MRSLPGVLLVGNFLSSSTGVRSVCEDLAIRLAANGWPVVTTSAKPGRIARVGDMVATVWRNQRDYDVAHVEVYSGSAFLWAELVCESLNLIGKPFVLTLHGGNLPAFAERRFRRARRLFESASIVTTPSEFLRERMTRYRADLILLPNPTDIDSYHFRPRVNPSPNLVWLRAFHEIYNPNLAPRVVALLTEEYPEIHLTMIGPDKGDGSLQKTKRSATDLGVAHRISFHGPVPKGEVPLWLNHHDIFLNTTNIDNTPVSVIEAMACGLCVVSTNVGGIPYILDDGCDALLVPPDDAEAMASAVKRILIDRSLSAGLTDKARQKAESFDWPEILPQWEQILMQAVTADGNE
jgi:glycosyltransferase involved in cell wall biosynthesis